MKKWCHNCQDLKMVKSNGFAKTNYGELVFLHCETCNARIGTRKVRVKLNPDNFIRREQ